jgi:predicted DNA-binding protein (MmcQ/YjbR family)
VTAAFGLQASEFNVKDVVFRHPEMTTTMNVEEIRTYCLSFPEATENLQWGDDLCFKIRGKIFTTVALTAVPQKLCFKCTPQLFAELTEREDIAPAPYVGRYHWVILHRLDALRGEELKDFIRWSYEAAAEKAPKSKAGKPKAKKSKARKSRTKTSKAKKKVAVNPRTVRQVRRRKS